MASHRHSALVNTPAAHSLVNKEISVKVKVPDTVNLLAGGYGCFLTVNFVSFSPPDLG